MKQHLSILAAGCAVALSAPAFAAQTPYQSAHKVPGLIQATHFDNGGQGVSYYDTSNRRGNNHLRGGRVDLGKHNGKYKEPKCDLTSTSANQTMVRYSNLGFLGWIDAGEWLEYTIDVEESGLYAVNALVSSPEGNGAFHVEFDYSNSGPIDMTAINIDFDGDYVLDGAGLGTGAWYQYEMVRAPNWVYLEAGEQTMRVVMDGPGFNLYGVGLGKVSPAETVGREEFRVPDGTLRSEISACNTEWVTGQAPSYSGPHLAEANGGKLELAGAGGALRVEGDLRGLTDVSLNIEISRDFHIHHQAPEQVMLEYDLGDGSGWQPVTLNTFYFDSSDNRYHSRAYVYLNATNFTPSSVKIQIVANTADTTKKYYVDDIDFYDFAATPAEGLDNVNATHSRFSALATGESTNIDVVILNRSDATNSCVYVDYDRSQLSYQHFRAPGVGATEFGRLLPPGSDPLPILQTSQIGGFQEINFIIPPLPAECE